VQLALLVQLDRRVLLDLLDQLELLDQLDLLDRRVQPGQLDLLALMVHRRTKLLLLEVSLVASLLGLLL
jgi:hypothetical protein